MSVSHPLAANDAQTSAEADPKQRNRQDSAASDAKHAESSNQSATSDLSPSEYLIHAPEQLGLETRREFREVASSLVDRIPAGAGLLVIDCAPLKSIDSAGLFSLILVRRRAAARRVRIVLRHLREELVALLVLTKLDDLFELEDARAR